jgi:hypothetical protein
MYLAPLNYNRFFKKVFANEKIARRFLEDTLEVKIDEFEPLKEKHKITDDAAAVEFDFRCKIGGAYVIIDMQQWYKWDVVQRFYIYHVLNTGLQLEDLPQKELALLGSTSKFKKIRDYRLVEPVITLIWMVVDALGSDDDYIAFTMAPENIIDFIRNETLWHNPEILELIKERAKLLNVINNGTKSLDFLPKNRLIFMFQKNIVKNKKIKKYERWFEFAEKTRNENNTKEDFKEYEDDEIFCEIMKRLDRTELNENDFIYIKDEKGLWERVEILERGILEEGLNQGEKIGFGKGEKKGKEEKAFEIAKNLLIENIPHDIISKVTGLNLEQINEISSGK